MTARGYAPRVAHRCCTLPTRAKKDGWFRSCSSTSLGTPARSDQADPEDVRDVLRSTHADVKEQIERFGGIVEKFIGDAVMAVFGAPHAYGDDAERAVRAGLRAVAAVHAVEVAGRRGALSARAAVATGEAVVNVDDARSAGDALAMGDVVNTASRLQSAAPVGAVVVDAATFQASRRNLRFEVREPVVAKGKADPIPVWQAMAVAGSPWGRTPGGGPMIGRDHELSLLCSTWARSAEQRRPHLAVVVGVAGAGKSRLIHEFGGWVAEQHGQVIRGRCLPYEQADVYGAFTQQLKQLAGIDEADSPSQGVTKIEQLVQAVVPEAELSDVLRSCSVLLGPGPEKLVGLEQSLLLYGFRRLVEAVSLRRPTLWLFEDMHWADAAEFDLIRYLATHVRDVPATIVGVARPELVETRPDWNTGLLTATAIVLEPLSERDATAVVAALAGTRLEPDQVQRLVVTADGNPLFLEELVGAVLEGADASGRLPTSVLGAIASRIDMLPTRERSLLLAASVIGRHFWVGPLRELPDGHDAAAVLDILEAKDFVRRQPTSSVRGEIEYVFRHALIREVCYGILPRTDRADAHDRIATYLEAHVGDDRDLAWLLAHHWEKAGQPTRAVPHLLVAAQRAKSALAEQKPSLSWTAQSGSPRTRPAPPRRGWREDWHSRGSNGSTRRGTSSSRCCLRCSSVKTCSRHCSATPKAATGASKPKTRSVPRSKHSTSRPRRVCGSTSAPRSHGSVRASRCAAATVTFPSPSSWGSVQLGSGWTGPSPRTEPSTSTCWPTSTSGPATTRMPMTSRSLPATGPSTRPARRRDCAAAACTRCCSHRWAATKRRSPEPTR